MAIAGEIDRNHGKCWQDGCNNQSLNGSWFCSDHCKLHVISSETNNDPATHRSVLLMQAKVLEIAQKIDEMNRLITDLYQRIDKVGKSFGL